MLPTNFTQNIQVDLTLQNQPLSNHSDSSPVSA